MPGKSFITTTLGYLVIVLTWLNQVFVEQGIPQSGKAWITFLTGNIGGLIGVFAKDFNQSHAQNPTTESTVVPPSA